MNKNKIKLNKMCNKRSHGRKNSLGEIKMYFIASAIDQIEERIWEIEVG